jgi:hypothetical protein
MLRKWGPFLLTFAVTALILAAGCNKSTNRGGDSSGTSGDATGKGPDGEHAHKPGQHGGTIVEIGRDNYHAEAAFGDKGEVKLYMLGKDEARVQEVEIQSLSASARAEGELKGVEMTLEPRPRPDDSKGKTSVFVGTLPEGLRDKRVEVTVPTIRIEGARFRFSFKNYKEGQHGAGMPKAISGEKMKKLYATAKGKYTEADIKANGVGVTGMDRYGNVMTEHDDDPKPGDKICPISRTKANPKITWVVGGKTYEFCCTPCINEFVKKAQDKPAEIKDPGEYVKK